MNWTALADLADALQATLGVKIKAGSVTLNFNESQLKSYKAELYDRPDAHADSCKQGADGRKLTANRKV